MPNVSGMYFTSANPWASQLRHERFVIGKAQDALRQVAIGALAVATEDLTDQRQHVAEVPAVEPAEEPVARLRELQDRDTAAGSQHADHLARARVGVGDVAQAEGDRDELKRVVGEGQGLRIGLDKADAASRAGRCRPSSRPRMSIS